MSDEQRLARYACDCSALPGRPHSPSCLTELNHEQTPPPHEYVEVRSAAGLRDPDSLDERLRRAEHHAGLLEIGRPGRQSHCWLCRRHSEAQKAAREAAKS